MGGLRGTAADAGRDGAAYARNRVGDVPWLDDVAQETLLTVHAARRTYDWASVRTGVLRDLSSRMIDVLRKERRVSARELGTDVSRNRRPLRNPPSRIGRSRS